VNAVRGSSAPRLSRGDSLRFTASQMLPLFLRGLFTRRPRWSALLDRVQSDPQGVALVRGFRQRYGGDYLWLTMSGKPTLLVLHADGIRQVLDASPVKFGPPDLKVKGLSHFQPDAVTVSVGDAWRRRRSFSDAVLASGTAVHPHATEFLQVIESVTAPMTARDTLEVRWGDMHGAFRAITAGVVFGRAVESESVIAQLDALMSRANLLVGSGDTPQRQRFHDSIRARITDPAAGGLAALACPHLTPDDPIPVVGQVPQWLFAMKDTLAANCTNALALLASHPEAQARARAEAAAYRPDDAGSVGGMAFIEGSLRDAMRLWPTTPLVVRRALADTKVAGHAVPAGAQVLIHNGYNHRNPDWTPEPDRFHPEMWRQGRWDYRFNYMSNGPQACGGRELALFIGTAMLARLLQHHEWALVRPSLDPARPMPYALNTATVALTARRSPPAAPSSPRRTAASPH
jgi:cytochrome P450